MDIAPGGPPADALQDAIEAARSDLTTAAGGPTMRRDPYGIILRALAAVLAIFGRSITRWEQAVQDVIDARVMPEEDRQALRAELAAAVEDGAYRGMRKEANRMIRALDRRLAVQIGLAVGGAFVAGALLAVSVLFLGSLGPFSPVAERNAAWQTLIQANPDPRPALAQAAITADQTGRRYYTRVSLWLDPPPPPAAR